MSRPPDNLALDNLGFFAALVLAALARVLVFLSIASSFRSSLGAGSSTMGLIGTRSRSLVEHRRPGGQWRVWLSAPIDRSRDLRATLERRGRQLQADRADGLRPRVAHYCLCGAR